MAVNKQDWVPLQINKARYERLFGTSEIRKRFPEKEESIPTLSAESLGVAPVEDEDAIPVLEAAELLIEPADDSPEKS